jgi:hypothetical protein
MAELFKHFSHRHHPQHLEGEWRQTIKAIHTLKVVGENNIDLQLKRSAHHFLNHHKTQKRKAM